MPKPSGDGPSDVLFLAPEAPYPVLGGGPMRTASLIEYFWRNHSVDVITFREPGAPDPVTYFPPDIHVLVLELPRHSKTTLARATRNLARAVRGVPPLVDRFGGFDREIARFLRGRCYALGIIEHFWCAPYSPVLRGHCDRLLLNLHNIESVLMERIAVASGGATGASMRHFARRSRSMETRWLPGFDTVLVTSEEDRAHLPVPSLVYPNAIPLVPLPKAEPRHEIVFSGNLEYEPNKAAVRWFHQQVWPELKQSCPELTWRLLGKNERAVRSRLCHDDRIVLTGPVSDAIQSLSESQVAVVPIVSGSGTRIKIIEAWAAGLPVVSTRLGAEGLPGIGGEHLLLADTPADFAAAVRRLLDDEPLRDRLGAAGRRLYEEKLTWNAAWCTLERAGL